MKVKNIITLLLFVFFVKSINAQEHLAFKGVPIDGTLSSFVTKMRAKGFTSMGTAEGVAMLKGDFAAHKSCTILVATMQNRDLVSRIAVIFPDQSQWQYLYGDYAELKKLLTIKYGDPTDCVEDFQCPSYSYPNDDNDRMHNVRMDRCKYYSTFSTQNGEIQLSITHGDYSHCFVKLLYIDKVNNDSVIQDALDDL